MRRMNSLKILKWGKNERQGWLKRRILRSLMMKRIFSRRQISEEKPTIIDR
jgi:hypothetical protein